MANQFYVEPAQFGPGLSALAGSVQQFGEQQRAQQKAAEQEAYAEQAKQAMTQAFQSGDPRQIMQVGIQYPEVSETMQQLYGFTNDMTEQAAKEGYRRFLATQDPSERLAILEGTVDTIGQLGGRPVLSQQDVERFKRDPEGTAKSIEMAYAGIDPAGYDALTGSSRDDVPARLKTFNALVDMAQNSPDPFVRESAKRELGARAKEGTLSSSERIAADEVVGEQVASQEARETAATEEAKLGTQLKIKPQIERAVQEAEDAAKREGEALSEYGRAQASMPGLREVVNKLKTLSDVATYTMGGKVFDTMVKELGFGATEGATARAKMESLVNNQILPLLRDTFGAQFTEREGEQLRRTMLDIDAAPEQKKQILDSFIEQKMRDLEMKRGRVEETGAATEAQQTNQDQPRVRIKLDAQGNIIQ